MADVAFQTSGLYELDLNLINVLITQANNNEESKEAVIRACNFVIEKLVTTKGNELNDL